MLYQFTFSAMQDERNLFLWIDAETDGRVSGLPGDLLSTNLGIGLGKLGNEWMMMGGPAYES